MRETRLGRALRRLVLTGGLVVAMVAGGTAAWAYWSAQGTATGAPLVSGSLDMTVTTGSETLVGPGGTTTLPGLTLTNAVPGSSVSASFTINNRGTATFVPAVTPSSSLASLTTTVWYGGTVSGTTCTGGTTTPPTLASAASVPVCVATALAPGAPATDQGQTATVTLSLTATQVSP